MKIVFELKRACLEPGVTMNMWTFILAGLLHVTLGSALDDAGVYIEGTYSQGKFEKRVWPLKTLMACTIIKPGTFEWFRIGQWERVLLDFAAGKNDKNATFRLGTPSIYVAVNNSVLVGQNACKFVPTASQNVTATSLMARINPATQKMEYYAVKVNNTEQATLKKGYNYVKNLVKNRFSAIKPEDLKYMVTEIAASGQVYVGLIQGIGD